MLLTKYYSGDRITKKEWGGMQHVWGRSVYRDLMGKFKGNRSLGRSRRRREDNITTDIQEVGLGMDWIDLAQYKDRWLTLVNVAVNFRVP